MNNDFNQNPMKESKSNSLIAILSIVILILIGGCIYLYVSKSNGIETKNNNTAINNGDDCPVCETCKTCDVCKTEGECNCPVVENRFSVYATNLGKSESYQIISGDDNWEQYSIKSVDIKTDGSVLLWYDKATETGKSLATKYGNNYYELPLTDVVSAHFFYDGTGGSYPESSFIFVKKDGTVYALDSKKMTDSNTIDTYKLEYKDIVYVYSTMLAGARVTIGVDIKGNTEQLILSR